MAEESYSSFGEEIDRIMMAQLAKLTAMEASSGASSEYREAVKELLRTLVNRFEVLFIQFKDIIFVLMPNNYKYILILFSFFFRISASSRRNCVPASLSSRRRLCRRTRYPYLPSTLLMYSIYKRVLLLSIGDREDISGGAGGDHEHHSAIRSSTTRPRV